MTIGLIYGAGDDIVLPKNEDGTVKLAANPPSIGQVWAEMEKTLASGKAKAIGQCKNEQYISKRSHFSAQASVISLSRRGFLASFFRYVI